MEGFPRPFPKFLSVLLQPGCCYFLTTPEDLLLEASQSEAEMDSNEGGRGHFRSPHLDNLLCRAVCGENT